mmetsp:Transcript_27815/g.74923  ORF Transcript_27815/g.74923 Transcript_27815/m.74923 type:complete len:721 (-) Transcript_27815:369-2531(-)|eukprot:CAMPEP_0185157770 /NCGR_PEP_ID=MMETSP1139-20130426/1976_1 /TAXON_ID=298111 /ORGANISM="Pavlova sp., Strain CCMP459" /LENGTH=720 /DNA_ID=CAMNT_0027722871 /DNA_START=85 /DNA_END=2247 /DNA_ORIENTATION=+
MTRAFSLLFNALLLCAGAQTAALPTRVRVTFALHRQKHLTDAVKLAEVSAKRAFVSLAEAAAQLDIKCSNSSVQREVALYAAIGFSVVKTLLGARFIMLEGPVENLLELTCTISTASGEVVNIEYCENGKPTKAALNAVAGMSPSELVGYGNSVLAGIPVTNSGCVASVFDLQLVGSEAPVEPTVTIPQALDVNQADIPPACTSPQNYDIYETNSWRSLAQTYSVNPLGSAPAATHPLIGIIEFGGSKFSPNDLLCLQVLTGAKTSTRVTSVYEAAGITGWDCATGDFSGCDPDGDAEPELDVQAALTMNQNADAEYVSLGTGPEGVVQMGGAFMTAFIAYLDHLLERDSANISIPDILSISYSAPEGYDTLATEKNPRVPDPGYVVTSGQAEVARAVCDEMYVLALAGVTTFVSSGDGGCSNSRKNTSYTCNAYRAAFPASCPWVTAVGGTQMSPVGCTACEVTAMADGLTGTSITSGGGISDVFTVSAGYDMSWQIGSPAPHNRTYPDISAIGSNFGIILNGGVQAQDGTSISAPVMAGLVSLAYTGTRFGWINALLYDAHNKSAKTPNPIFFDVTEGNNGYGEWGGALYPSQKRPGSACYSDTWQYQTKPGYDLTSGLGSLGHGAQRLLLKLTPELPASLFDPSLIPPVRPLTMAASSTALTAAHNRHWSMAVALFTGLIIVAVIAVTVIFGALSRFKLGVRTSMSVQGGAAPTDLL